MSVNSVRKYLAKWQKDQDVREFEESSATVELAALRLSVEPARIAKTISFYEGVDSAILVIASGDKKIDNAKYKSAFGMKAKMLSPDDVLRLTGHAVGGVCPFDNPAEAKVYADLSLQRYDTIFPACGSCNSVIELTCGELFSISGALGWVDVCKEG